MLSDVDVYDVPGGKGHIIGNLDGLADDGAGARVELFGCNEQNWCQVSFPDGPDRKGWVFGTFLDK